MDFTNIDYLLSGSATQKQAYQVLKESLLMEKLEDFTPVLTGTIPIDIAIKSSDLDIICCFEDVAHFRKVLNDFFGKFEDFSLKTASISGTESVIANFTTISFPVEIFGQNIPVKKQMAYRHMLVEHRLLQENSDDFRREIIRLKNEGYKTEPAFARILGLKGDPYIELLRYEL